MTKRKLLLCSIGMIAAVAGWLTLASLVPCPLAQATTTHNADSRHDSGQWTPREPLPLAEFEADDAEKFSDGEKAPEASSHCLPVIYPHAILTAACQPTLLTTLNALRVRLQI